MMPPAWFASCGGMGVPVTSPAWTAGRAAPLGPRSTSCLSDVPHEVDGAVAADDVRVTADDICLIQFEDARAVGPTRRGRRRGPSRRTIRVSSYSPFCNSHSLACGLLPSRSASHEQSSLD